MLRTPALLALALALNLCADLAGAPRIAAQERTTGRATGHELSLEGTLEVTPGRPKVFSGTAFEVLGLATLRPLRRGRVSVNLLSGTAGRQRAIASTEVNTDAEGHFVLSLEVPETALESPTAVFVVGVGRAGAREQRFSLRSRAPARVELRLDRQRYQPGEKVRVWARASDVDGGAPRRGLPLSFDIGATGVEGRRELRTSGAGVAAYDFELPETIADGSYRVQVHGNVAGTAFSDVATFVIQRRTVERMLVEVELEENVVVPGATLRGQVVVTTPSGTPVVGADVTVEAAGTTIFRTDEEGRVSFSVLAPSYTASDIETQQLRVNVRHPAHGALGAARTYTIARARWRVEAVAAAGAIVPEVRDRVFVLVADVEGGVAPEGTALRVRGPGITAEARVDTHGYAEFPVQIADDAAGPLRREGCDGSPSVPLTVEILDAEGQSEQVADVCVRVAPDADVLPRVESPIVAPGETATVRITRRPRARGRAVVVEALMDARVVAAVRGEGDRLELRVPTHARGLLVVRARPLAGSGELRGVPDDDVPGVASTGAGAMAALLVRPRDAFALSLAPERDPYEVQEQAQIRATTRLLDPRGAADGAWIAMVARDLTQHGGEVDWTVDWLHRRFKEAALLARPDGDALRLLEAALAGTLGRDLPAPVAAPLDPPPGFVTRERRSAPLRDPLHLRDELLRRGAARFMVQLEAILRNLSGDEEARRGVIAESGGRQRFDPELLATLRRRRTLPQTAGTSLGGGLIEIAELQQADASFTWDNVARRLARERLVRLLASLASLSDPDSVEAARASAGLPPSRWLGRLVELQMVSADALIDPWGHPFVLRQTRAPVISFSERAPDWELVSAGPDGRAGTADDVRDPFARILPEGSPFALASGEDNLMRALSVLSPGPATLQAMLAAFQTVSLAAQDEQRQGIVLATRSEGAEDDMAFADAPAEMEEAMGVGGLGMVGRGAGGGGSGYGRGSGSMRAPARARAQSMPPAPVAAAVSGGLAGRIREDFPATLHFLPEQPLDPDGTTSLALPLADALTTYRVETIAWASSGWTVSARTEIHVDQAATVDAPIPPYAVAGDVLRIPVRVENRGADPLSVRVRLVAEDVALDGEEPATLTLPPRRARETVVEVRVPRPGSGHVIVELQDEQGQRLDAVRRPLRVYTSARTIERELAVLLAPGASYAVEIPQDAIALAPSSIRMRPGGEIFGTLESLGATPVSAAWARALVGEAPSAEQERALSQLLSSRHGGVEAMRALGAAYARGSIPDDLLRAALERLGTTAENDPEWLLALAPALRFAAARPAPRQNLHETLLSIGEQRRRAVLERVLALGEPHADLQLYTALYALAAIGDTTNAQELLRRAEPDLVQIGDEAFVELGAPGGWSSLPAGHLRVAATTLRAAALALLGEREAALPLLRYLVRAEGLDVGLRSGLGPNAWAAARVIVGEGASALPTLLLDGEPVTLEAPTDAADGIVHASLPVLATPGRHRLEIRGDTLALATVSIRYGRPWDAAPRRALRVDLAVVGEPGPRDARAALVLRLRSRAPQVLQHPELRIDLPAGVELDEPTRRTLARYSRGTPTMEGRTLRVPLAPLAPGARRQLPLPLRWSVGGQLRGLGVVLSERGTPGDEPPAAVLAPSVTPVADEGPEPARPELTPDDDPDPPTPIVPLPEPVPLSPVAALSCSSEVFA